MTSRLSTLFKGRLLSRPLKTSLETIAQIQLTNTEQVSLYF